MTDDPGAALEAERADAGRQVDQLRHDLAEVMAASRDSNADDEHDPEGATIGFERAQLTSLLAAAQRRLADADRALVQVRTGGYGTCERCGGAIGAERLAARPSARTCIGCASRP